MGWFSLELNVLFSVVGIGGREQVNGNVNDTNYCWQGLFFLFLIIILASLLNNIDYTIAYVFPLANIECRTRARSELLNVSIVSPRVKFYTVIHVPIPQHSKCYEVYIVDPKLMDPIVELSLFQDGIVKVLASQLYGISA